MALDLAGARNRDSHMAAATILHGASTLSPSAVMHLSLLSSDPERLGLPSGSHLERLVHCRASHAMSMKARQLGQATHEDSEAAQQGTRIHETLHTGNLEELGPEERELAEDLRRQELDLLSEWKRDSTVQERREERFYLRREGHLFPIFTGQPDLVFSQGNRALIIDRKLGRRQVSAPSENWQLRAYAVLLAQADPGLEEITVAIQSPFFKYQPAIYGCEELDQFHRLILTVLASLSDPGEPMIGSWCTFCPGSMICPARSKERNQLAIPVQELPSGTDAARLLEMVARVEAVCDQIKAHYKAQLETDSSCVPGWRLQSSSRRWIPHPEQAFERLIEQFTVSEFLECTSVSVSELERAWASKNNVPTAQARVRFSRYMGACITENRVGPSLRQTTNQHSI